MRHVTIFILATVSIIFGQHICPWSTISSGAGAMFGTNYISGGTAGQTAIGSMTSTNFITHIGFWQIGLTPAITEQEKDITIDPNILTIKLYNAKPNPFNIQTNIRYSLPTENKVSLEIYDASGRLIKTLVNQKQTLGIYSVNWNGKNERNQKLSASVYFYKLQTKNYTSTKKILLIE